MRFLLFLLLSLYAASAWGQEFVCAFGLEPEGVSGASSHNVAHYQRGTVKMLILFGKLNGAQDAGSLTQLWNRNEDASPLWSAADLLNSEFEGSLAHYFKEMSYGALTLSPGSKGIPMKFYQSNNSTIGVGSYNIPQIRADCTVPNWTRGMNWRTTTNEGMRQFVREVLENADKELKFSRLATSGVNAGFSEYDGDKDGNIDIIGVVTPRTVCSYSGTVFYNIQYPDPDNPSKMITVDRVVTTDWRRSFPYIVGVVAHEYGHAMGLPELYDRDHFSSNDSASHSAGIGAWGTMGRSASWDHEGARRDPADNPRRAVDGPNPLSVWSRIKVGWITDDTSAPRANQRLESVTGDKIVDNIHDINSSDGKVYKIPLLGSTTEYFLVANRQNRYPSSGSFYDTYAPASGLLIWHIDELARSGSNDANKNEFHKRVDLECADGLFSDKGYPDGNPDPVSGGDNLDYWSDNSTYRTNHNGQPHGDATDVWDGSTYTEFTPDTNPSTYGYEAGGKPETKKQNVFSGIYIENIGAGSLDGAMMFDVRFAPRAPNSLDAAVGENRVELSWAPPLANGATIASYKVRHRLSTESRWTDTLLNDASARTHTVMGLIQDNEYTFEVLAVSAMQGSKEGKEGAAARITATPQRTIVGPESVDFPENGEDMVARYEKSGSFTWSLEGDDAARFELLGTGGFRLLDFESSPNFEDPQDIGLDNIYNVTVKATLVGASGQAHHTRFMKAITVKVTNVDERGTVTVSSPSDPPRVGETLTAKLEDPDGIIPMSERWTWQRQAEPNNQNYMPTWIDIDNTNSTTYMPVADDIGYQLRAYATYTDGHGPNKKRDSKATSLVIGVPSVLGVPSAPQDFKAVRGAGAGEVDLRWEPPESDGGLPIDVYKVLYFSETQPNTDQAGLSVVPGGASARDTTIEGLTNGTRYVFRVAAHNEAGNGVRAEAKATPQVPCQLTGALAPTFAENATGVVSTYTASAGCGSALSWVLGGTDASAFKALQGTGPSRTLEFNDPPNFERPADDGKNNTYSVSVSIGDVSVSVIVSVTDANDSGLVRLSTTSPQAGQSLTATLSDEDGIEEPVYWTPHYGSASDGGGVTGQASEATQTWTLIIPNRRVGQPLRIQADYTDSFGAASATSARTSPVRAAPNRAPSVSGPAAVEVAENSLAPWLLGTYIGRDADGDDLTWSVTGTDARAFAELKEPASPGAEPSRELHLASTPDYEAQASYDVWVKVSDAALSDSLRVSVSVLNQNEAGEVVLTGGLPPEVGTAVVAALTDPDGGITGASWQWQRRLGATGSWEDIGSGVSGASSAVSGTASTYPELSSYTPVQADVGWQLQATVRYRDGHDSSTERTAESTASVAVLGPPGAPSGVSVRSGWAQVRVEWPAVASATDYAVQRQGKPFDRGSWPSAWTSLASNLVGRPRYVDRGVSPDSLYRYQVRVRVGALVSAWSAPQPSAGVQPGVGPPTGFTAEAGASQATLRWTGPDHASITKWRYRDVTALGADTEGGWQDLVVRGSASTEWSAPVDGLTPGQAYRFQVRAANGAGGGHPSAVSNTVTPWLARPTGGSVAVQAGPALEVSWASVASATGYEVQGQSKPFDGESWPSAWTTQQANGTQPYVHQGVDADLRYRYRVRSRVGETASAWSDTLPGVAGVQPPPGAPTGLTATPGNRQVRLTWTGPTHASIAEWQFKRGQILEPLTAWAGWRSISTAATTRSYTVQTGLENGKSYIFQVQVRNGGGWSAAARSDTVALPADTKGRVSLSTTAPQVGDKLTATLTDPDNPTEARFTWSFFRPAGASGANGADPPPSAVQSEPLRVSTVHLGLQILARVSSSWVN